MLILVHSFSGVTMAQRPPPHRSLCVAIQMETCSRSSIESRLVDAFRKSAIICIPGCHLVSPSTFCRRFEKSLTVKFPRVESITNAPVSSKAISYCMTNPTDPLAALGILLLWQINPPRLSFRRRPESLQTVGVCQNIPASAGMTVGCLFDCQKNRRTVYDERLGLCQLALCLLNHRS
jgi:hypothetical protein